MADDRRGSVRIDASKALKMLARTPGAIGKRTTRAMQENGQEFVAAMTLGIRERFKSHTGSFRRAPGYQVTGDGLRQSLRVFMSGVNPKAVRAQEYGGTFRSTRPGGKLAIPIDDNLTPAGVAKIPSAREAIQRGAFVLRLKRGGSFKGGAYIVAREGTGKDANLLFLFRLVDSVTLKPRLGFRDTWTELAPDRAARLRAAFAAGIADARAGRG